MPDSDEAPNEIQSCRGDLLPAAVDRQRVTTPRNLYDLGYACVVVLQQERRVRDRPWHRVVLLAGDDEQRAAVWVLGVDLHFGPRVEVRGRRLEERCTGRRDRERLVELLRFLLADRVGERVAELLVRERHGTMAVGRVAEDGERRTECGDREGQHTAERSGIARDGRHRARASRENLREQATERVPDDRGLLAQSADDLLGVIRDLSDRLV